MNQITKSPAARSWWEDAVIARLEDIAATGAATYQAAEPFPHIVIDDFLPEDLLSEALAAFPDPETLKWIKFDNRFEKKLAFSRVDRLPPSLRDLLYFLNGPDVLVFLEKLTGIEHLISDPYYEGGGLHQIPPGGKLGIHADFNLHKEMNLDRRLNLLLYLNKDWAPEYGGNLELWDRKMKGCQRVVEPIFNRCVVFSTTSDAFHGHPHALTCPPDRTRKSVATYYYTAGRPEEEKHEAHATLFREAPSAKVRIKQFAKAVIPPFIWDGVKAMQYKPPKPYTPPGGLYKGPN
jgi:Rps23 Pro-64 3,4-dihydroxylase Tpa1-like proline 4-hydroxylase